jgi:hypothetical protein
MFNKFKNDIVDTHIKRTQAVNQIDLLITKLEWLKSAINSNDRSMMQSRASNISKLMHDVLVTCKIIKYFCD